jgi:hypothetical protein
LIPLAEALAVAGVDDGLLNGDDRQVQDGRAISRAGDDERHRPEVAEQDGGGHSEQNFPRAAHGPPSATGRSPDGCDEPVKQT